jgi:hypothetical protein
MNFQTVFSNIAETWFQRNGRLSSFPHTDQNNGSTGQQGKTHGDEADPVQKENGCGIV